MKVAFVLVLALLLAMCLPVVAQDKLTFQTTNDLNKIGIIFTDTSGSTYSYVKSITGDNSYFSYILKGTDTFMVINTNPQYMTYAAATMSSPSTNGYNVIYYYTSSMVPTALYVDNIGETARYEVKISGGTAKIYANGVLKVTRDGFLQNPSYISFGGLHAVFNTPAEISGTIDNVIYGNIASTEYIIGIPDNTQLILLKDMVTPASSGIAFANNGSVVQSTYMPITFGRGDTAIPPDVPYTNKSINLVNYETGTVYSTQYTATDMFGSRNFLLADLFNSATAPSGLYAVTVEGSGQYSDLIFYGSNGASVSFDRDTYSKGDTAQVSYAISSGGYWDASVYTYSMKIQDVFGNVIDTYPLLTQSGTVSVPFEASDDMGVYYAIVEAVTINGVVHTAIGYDTCELNGYVTFQGLVHNAETSALVTGADIRFNQGTIWKNVTSGSIGNYTTSGSAFQTGSLMYINVTKSGYYQYTRNFTPMSAKTVDLNFTLMPTPTHSSGIAILGIIRDKMYGRPIPAVNVNIYNTTYGESYNVVGSDVGYYKADATNVNLSEDRTYFIVGSKSGYENSVVYNTVVRTTA